MALFGTFSLFNLVQTASLLLIYLFLIVVSVVAASAIANSSLIASGIGFGMMIFYSSIWGLIPKIEDFSPAFIISNYKEVVLNGWNGDFLPSVLTSIVLMIVTVSVALASFKRQEIER